MTVYLHEVLLPARVWCACSDGSTYVDVDHLDGMYSFGRSERGAVAHLHGCTPLAANADGTFTLAEPPC